MNPCPSISQTVANGRFVGTMEPTAYEKSEWYRFANALPACMLRHDLFLCASIPRGEFMPLADFDRLQRFYRSWLVFGTIPSERELNRV